MYHEGKETQPKTIWLNILTSTESQNAKQEQELFIQTEVYQSKDHFSFFDKDIQFLDTFLGKCVSGNVGYVYFRRICKVAFILLHCQASFEREFSVNKELLVNNKQKKSLIS